MTELEELERCRPLLEPILQRFQTHKWRDILIGIRDGRMKLWVWDRSCGVTEIADYPARRVLVLMLAAGDLDEVLAREQEIPEYAHATGCEALCVYGRPGWSKVAKNFEVDYIALSKEIRHGNR